MAEKLTVSLYESYIAKGAPTNRAGARRGYGRTPEEAHEAAGHWANQAPWARVRRVVVLDQEGPSSRTSRDEEIAWAICGVPGEFRPPSEAEKRRAALIARGRYASAVLDYYRELDG